MSYAEYRDMRKIDTAFPLPEFIKKYIPSSAAVAMALARGEDALELTLGKWLGILTALEYMADDPVTHRLYFSELIIKQMGFGNSALCVQAEKKLRKDPRFDYIKASTKCFFCPHSDTLRCMQPGSPYFQLLEIISFHSMGLNYSAHCTRDSFQEEFRIVLRLSRELAQLLGQLQHEP